MTLVSKSVERWYHTPRKTYYLRGFKERLLRRLLRVKAGHAGRDDRSSIETSGGASRGRAPEADTAGGKLRHLTPEQHDVG